MHVGGDAGKPIRDLCKLATAFSCCVVGGGAEVSWAFVPKLKRAHLRFALNLGKLDGDGHGRLSRGGERRVHQVLSDVCDTQGVDLSKGEGGAGCAR